MLDVVVPKEVSAADKHQHIHTKNKTNNSMHLNHCMCDGLDGFSALMCAAGL